MARNEILEEIYAVREALLAEHGGDVHAYVEAARKRALESGRLIAAPKQRTIRCTGAAKSGDLPVENLSSPPGER
ncbi:MAG: hypothetical protein H8E44_02915 [Planctomycetes bacterium]|nr:hypothetical protein [Planctomycetota bacterium]MBL7037738.1 hypothetical protein [Pirellulaceae bacterium]